MECVNLKYLVSRYSEKIALYSKEIIKGNDVGTDEIINSSDTDENDFVKSTIEDYLADIQQYIDASNYGILVDALYKYFTTSIFPELHKK